MIGAITVDPHVFRNVVSWVARWVPAQPALPHMAGISLVADGGQLTVTGSGEEASARGLMNLAAGTGLAVTVSGRLLSSLVGSLPNNDVLLKFMGDRLVVKAGAVTMTLPPMGEPAMPAEFPDDLPVVAVFPGADMSSAVAKVAPAASRNDYAGPLRAVRLMVSTSEPFSIMASDSYRAAWSTVSIDAKADAEVLVPADVLAEVTRTLRVVDLGADKNLVQFGSGGDFVLTVRQIAGSYPTMQVQRALQYRPPLYVIVPLPEFKAAVKRALLARTDKQPLILDWSADSKLCVSLRGDAGVAETMWVNHFDGPAVRMGVNPTYMLDALNALVGDMALIGLDPGQPKRPLVVADVDDDTYWQTVTAIDLSKEPNA